MGETDGISETVLTEVEVFECTIEHKGVTQRLDTFQLGLGLGLGLGLAVAQRLDAFGVQLVSHQNTLLERGVAAEGLARAAPVARQTSGVYFPNEALG